MWPDRTSQLRPARVFPPAILPMPKLRLRSAAPALLVMAALLSLSACGLTEYPNSTFNHTTDFNTSIDALFQKLVFWGTIVFVVVEAGLIYTIIKFRKRPGGPAAKQIHGNAALEITWTAIPALILVLIAVPSVKTIFETQKPAPAGALHVKVIGHQWWWEFQYPEYGITTANEVYVPVGRAVNFELTTKDVLHSFWIPQLGGKRDLITNKTNYLWFTPSDTLPSTAWNGFCTEYCGASHANMRIRMYTVQPDEFESWARHQAGRRQPSRSTACPRIQDVFRRFEQQDRLAHPSEDFTHRAFERGPCRVTVARQLPEHVRQQRLQSVCIEIRIVPPRGGRRTVEPWPARILAAQLMPRLLQIRAVPIGHDRRAIPARVQLAVP